MRLWSVIAGETLFKIYVYKSYIYISLYSISVRTADFKGFHRQSSRSDSLELVIDRLGVFRTLVTGDADQREAYPCKPFTFSLILVSFNEG